MKHSYRAREPPPLPHLKTPTCRTQKSCSPRRAFSAPIRPINNETHTDRLNRQRVPPALRCDGLMAAVPRAELFGSSLEGETPHPIRDGNESALESGSPAGLVFAMRRGRPNLSDGIRK